MAPADELLSEYLKQLKPGNTEVGDKLWSRDKTEHGIYYQQIKEVANINKSYQWLEKTLLKTAQIFFYL